MVRMAPVGGEALAFTPGALKDANSTTESRAAARRRMDGEGHLGDDYAHVYVPSIPAPDVQEKYSASECSVRLAASPYSLGTVPPLQSSWDKDQLELLPKDLRTPLIKTKDGTVAAIRSGGRSAIYMDGDQAYRLKGCASCPPTSRS